jgi:type VI secretion system Hcp family effector
MADHTIDAYLYFGTTASSKAQSHGGRLPRKGVEGETSDKGATAKSELDGYAWPVELHSYKFGFELDKDWAETDSATRDKKNLPHRAKLAPLVITKQFDMASPKLLEAINQVSVFDTVKLVHRRAGLFDKEKSSSSQTFLTAILSTVVVQSLDWETRDNGVLMETVQLDFCGIDVEYVPQSSKGGDDTENAVYGKASVEFPKTDRDRMRSFTPPEQPEGGDGRTDVLEDSITEVRKKLALLKGKSG